MSFGATEIKSEEENNNYFRCSLHGFVRQKGKSLSYDDNIDNDVLQLAREALEMLVVGFKSRRIRQRSNGSENEVEDGEQIPK